MSLFLHVGLCISYTIEPLCKRTQRIQQMHVHKAVAMRVKAQKLLSRRKQLDYRLPVFSCHELNIQVLSEDREDQFLVSFCNDKKWYKGSKAQV